MTRGAARRALAGSTVLLCVGPFVAALFGAPLDHGLASVQATHTGFDSSPASLWHALIEWTGFGVALASAITMLVLYSARREAAMPVVGVAMLAAGSLDAAHMLASSGLAHDGSVSLPAIESVTWLISRTCSALILLTGALVINGRARAHRGAGAGLVIAAGLTLIVAGGVLLFQAVNARELPEPFNDSLLTRPYDLVALVLFLAAGAVLLRDAVGGEASLLSSSLLISVIPQAAAQIAMAMGSTENRDGWYFSAHALKLLAYTLPFVGVLMDSRWNANEEALTLRRLREAQEEMAHNRELYRTLARNLPDTAVFIIDRLGAVVLVEGVTLQGASGGSARFPASPDGADLAPELRDMLQPALERALAGESSTTEYSEHSKVYHVHIVPVRVVADDVLACMVVVTDISEQRVAERSLRLTQFSVDRAADAVFWLGEDGRLFYLNDAGCRMLGYSSDELLAMSAPDIEPDMVEATWPERWLAVKRAGSLTIDTELRTRSGALVPVEMNTRYLQYDDREYLCAFARDVTERQVQAKLRTEKDAAEAANLAKSVFLAHMSHELRTPLNSVIGFANILLKNKAETFGDKDMTYLSRIRENGKNLLALINDVLDLSRVEAGKIALDVETVDVESMCRDVVEQLSVQIRERPVTLSFETLGSIPPIETDEGRLRQVVVNLVSNAIKFTERGEVRVRVGPQTGERGRIRIEVSDTGIGIPPDKLDAIFEPFQQADVSTHKRYGGTGLGLAITRGLVDLLGHRLEITSEPGVGSTFSVIARRTPRMASAPSTMHTPRGGHPNHVPAVTSTAPMTPLAEAQDALVLVIDDDSDAQVLLSHALEEMGCRVMTTGTGRDGLRLAAELMPDLVLLDLLMPEMAGEEVLKRFRDSRALRDIPVAIVSIVGTERAGSLEGAVAVLDKPASRTDLRAVLRDSLTRDRRKILVVDDDELVRRFISGLLRDEGVHVRTAANGEDAIRVLEHYAADLCIVDLSMPVMDGFGFLGALRSRDEFVELPVVVVTGRDLTPEESRFLEQEAQEVLHKGRDLAERLRGLC
ncbi:MAG: response regulator [Myxococcota bacterium]